MALRIKVECEEFDAAATDGYVYGELRLQGIIYVYIELGPEREYISQPSDNPNTEYRIFKNCNIFFAETEKQVDEGDFAAEQSGETVIIYR
jgi:hypothetical protein